MEIGSVVKIRCKRFFEKQKLWFFVGKVLEYSDTWVTVHGKSIVFDTGRVEPLGIDDEARTMMIPVQNICHVRILPDNFDIAGIEVYVAGKRWMMKVKGAPDASLAENG